MSGYENERSSRFDEEDNNQPPAQVHEIIVKNLDFNVEQDQLENFFANCGKIDEIKLPRKPNGSSKGYGFIQFASREALDEALKLNNQDFDGRPIGVALSSKAGGTQEERMNIFVGNLSYDTNEDRLDRLFSECGKIVAIRMPTDDRTGRPKGFAFIDFETAEAVDKALSFSGTELDGRQIRVDRGGSSRGRGGGRGGGGGGFRGGRGGGGFRGGYRDRDGGRDGGRDRDGGRSRYDGGRGYDRDRGDRDRGDRGGYRDRDDRGDRYRPY